MEAGLHLEDLAAKHGVSTRTIGRRIDECRRRFGPSWGVPKPRQAVVVEMDPDKLDEAALRRMARVLVARGASEDSTKEQQNRALLGLRILEHTSLGISEGERPAAVRDPADILAALERGGRVLPDPVH